MYVIPWKVLLLSISVMSKDVTVVSFKTSYNIEHMFQVGQPSMKPVTMAGWMLLSNC